MVTSKDQSELFWRRNRRKTTAHIRDCDEHNDTAAEARAAEEET
jgi:hypothetical protein